MVVTTSNLYSESRKVVKDLINQNVTDPVKGRKNSSRRWIYRQLPKTTSRDFTGYPIIVLPSGDAIDGRAEIKSQLSDTQLIFNIQVLGEFNDESARIDEISSEMYRLFIRPANIDILSKNNLFEPDVTGSAFALQTEDGKLLVGRMFTLSLQTTMEEN